MENVDILKNTSKFLLHKIGQETEERIVMMNILKLTTLLNNLNAELSAWGRGLDALSNGRLHPTLINPDKLRKGFQEIQDTARRFGLQPVHADTSSIYKNPISFLATADLQIIVFVHIPLIQQEPLTLLEHLAIPNIMGDLFVTIEGRQNILATDPNGLRGLELEESDLMRCQTEDRKDGKLYICPNTNLVKSNIRESCLGALFFGLAEKVMANCMYFPHRMEDQTEFAKQIAINKVIYYAPNEVNILEACQDSKQTLKTVRGLTIIQVNPGCDLIMENHRFKSPIHIDQETDFIKKSIKIPILHLLPTNQTEDIRNQLEILRRIKSPTRINLEELDQWIKKTKQDNLYQTVGFSLHLLTLTLGI
ncbi:MAG: hypothetical protein Q8O19_00400, partial [Rectinemataceae bacterium]|nr:hypothetical protein [Rectinemataceae bacterium]